ncbi:sigma-70 family RNA polymerase sigma factor [Marinifilum sp. N1E240]|uniref:RNA polymerase sigma factor n=1 Tax=Marinifilum sp. N1E240 TaxID=2608082 RepID=UPI00128BAC7A|nr:sigma-70 family RNA polymerase sigma factor [Marinifilum sp. N1E240]MPQ47503.1 sigma-70 family RNA polymerase sigma factor [Marinifilum sp. N1E240]
MAFRNDSYYITKIKAGDPGAYAVLVDKYKKMGFNVALQLMGNREDAEEVAQDSFLKAYQALDTYKGESKFSTWIYRIIYNTAISRLRKKKLDTSSIDDDFSASVNVKSTQSAVQELQSDERKQYINKALQSMSGEDRTLLTLFYLEENSVEEVCSITGLSTSNVKVKLHRARKKLYSQLELILHGELKTIL